jgi:hypothetical protein
MLSVTVGIVVVFRRGGEYCKGGEGTEHVTCAEGELLYP